LNQAKASR